MTETSPESRPIPSGAIVELRYVARAGLLPELSRQTYDTLYKSLREVVLNSLDAGATEVEVDLSLVESENTLTIRDDGCGMSLDDIRDSFLGLGGSAKFGNDDKFGRIGIGALALLHYATSAEIETKVGGAPTFVRASLAHPWWLDREQRTVALDDFPAGQAEIVPYSGDRRDHFTRIRLRNVDARVVEECSDIGRVYALIERLRLVLPLRWPDCNLGRALESVSPATCARLQAHIERHSGQIFVKTAWGGRFRLERRLFGSDDNGSEVWAGDPLAISREIPVRDERGVRTVTVLGYLLAQRRALTSWSGITARVQNVAVEERSFFDIEADPGFRKYITGEIFITGDIDRARLVNIDRTSFNRESIDYTAIRRFMADTIASFKAHSVQQPQRRRVAIRRAIEEHRVAIEGLLSASAAASSAFPTSRGVPSSSNGRLTIREEISMTTILREMGAGVEVAPSTKARYFAIHTERSDRDVVQISADLLEPRIEVCGQTYAIRFVRAQPSGAPVLVKNRPREIVFNLSHRVFANRRHSELIPTLLTLELAYLLGSDAEPNGLYDAVLGLLSAPAT